MNIKVTFAALLLSAAPVMQAEAQDPHVMKDNTRITISGTVVSADENSVILDYQGGSIKVDMGGWDWFNFDDSPNVDEQLQQGDRVIVYGEVDDDLFERTEIKADHVFVQDLGTQFSPQASPGQEGQQPQFYAATWTFVDFDTVVEGTVTSVSQEQNEFAIRTGTTSRETLIVDTSELENNPLDQEGFQQIKEGDRVAVSGNFDANFIENRRLIAENVVSMQQDRTKQMGSTEPGAAATTGARTTGSAAMQQDRNQSMQTTGIQNQRQMSGAETQLPRTEMPSTGSQGQATGSQQQ